MTIQFLLLSPDRREIFLCAPSLPNYIRDEPKKLSQSEIQGGVDKLKGSCRETISSIILLTGFYKKTHVIR